LNQSPQSINHSSTLGNIQLEMDAVLLSKAEAEGIDLSAELEHTLRTRLAHIEAERWQRENSVAIQHNNDELERNGLWSDGYRLF
jgi:antitoxin CcdA